MVAERCRHLPAHECLSVLALSSRFDGRNLRAHAPGLCYVFQYSLCRVVLMVKPLSIVPGTMVGLSVLALSSRFDGLVTRRPKR